MRFSKWGAALSLIELQDFLHRSVPLSRSMCVAVEEISSEHLVLSAPMEPNVNQHGTVFGGCSATLAVLAAWSLLHTRLIRESIDVNLVVQRSSMEYLAPMTGRFTALAMLERRTDWAQFVHAIHANGKARIEVQATMSSSARQAARFKGEFVAVRE